MEGVFVEREIVKCVSCDRFLVSGRWIDRLEPMLTKMFDRNVRLRASDPPLKGRIPKRIHLLLEVDDHELEIDLPARNQQCPRCSKRYSHYFEGELQLRGGNEHKYDRAKELLESHGGYVKSVRERRDGIDVKVTSNKAILATLKDLGSEYIGTQAVSTTLHTRDRQSGKEKRRVTGLFRFFALSKGDVVLRDGPFVIEKTHDSVCELRSLTDGRSITVDITSLGSKLETFETDVITIRPRLSILSESFVEVGAIDRSNQTLRVGDRVIALGYDGFYVVLRKAQ